MAPAVTIDHREEFEHVPAARLILHESWVNIHVRLKNGCQVWHGLTWTWTVLGDSALQHLRVVGAGMRGVAARAAAS